MDAFLDLGGETGSVALTCLFIVVARLADVSLGTFRTICVVNGRKGLALTVGFFEILIWVAIVRLVIHDLGHPFYALSYAGGFALGTYLGITLESHIGTGKQVLRAFSRRGEEIAECLRQDGFVVTCFEGKAREGPIHLIFLETDRRSMRRVVARVIEMDPDCFYVLDDVRLSSGRHGRLARHPVWARTSKRK